MNLDKDDKRSLQIYNKRWIWYKIKAAIKLINLAEERKIKFIKFNEEICVSGWNHNQNDHCSTPLYKKWDTMY